VLEDLSVDFNETAPETPTGGEVLGSSTVTFVALANGASCLSATDANEITTVGAPAGHTGTVVVPIDPGFVVPQGFQLFALGNPFGTFSAYFSSSGYFVPSSDAPSTPS
jgi:stage V sporulation protein SpoVS